jgi:hypothetical protein
MDQAKTKGRQQKKEEEVNAWEGGELALVDSRQKKRGKRFADQSKMNNVNL